VDAASRAKALFEQGATTEELVLGLRSDGLSLIESISALAKAAGMSGSDASAAVLDSPTWADERSLVTMNEWIDPPDPPDEATLERLRAACREEPWIVEAWVVGSRMTRADGHSDESTGIALILDPPLSSAREEQQSRASGELVARLWAAAPQAGDISSWLFVSEQIIAAHAGHCLKFYARAAPPA
jgi:hypothetical protein